MDKLKKNFFGGGDNSPSEEVNFASNITDTSSLSWSTRIQGCAFCFALGFLLCMIGVGTMLLPGGISRFALLYTLGNILSLCSVGFLVGPVKQLKKMFDESRYLATLGMLAFLILTIIAAHKRKLILCLIFSVLQFLSLAYYVLSYIPFARDAVRRTVTSII